MILRALALAFFIFVNDPCVAAGVTGLRVTFSSRSVPQLTDTTALPNVWLFVSENESPSPFISAGPFDVLWEGTVSAELRGDYSFQAELQGEIEVRINGEIVLAGTNITTPGKSVRLNKGPNKMAVQFRSPPKGAASVRLFWIPKGSYAVPIPSSALFHESNEALAHGNRLRKGRELFVEHRCHKCHETKSTGMPELAMDAPAFETIGARRNQAWMAAWIHDPKGLRPSAHMPKMFRGTTAKSATEDIAAFLASLGDSSESSKPTFTEERIAAGKQLFEKLHCIACHTSPEVSQDDPGLIALKHVTAKFKPLDLPKFLQAPEAHYAWIKMPNFKLSSAEATQLSSWLLADRKLDPAEALEKSSVARGRELLQSSGCLNCHALNLPNTFKAPPSLAGKSQERGCLAADSEQAGTPFYNFGSEDRIALLAFIATDQSSLNRHVPAEFADRQSRSLRCAECHGKVEGVPSFEILGEKLKPEWSGRFIGGKIDYKPRPWLEARMPGFASRANALGQGLAGLHGYPPVTPAEPAIEPEASRVGQKLVSPVGGFSCIMCHAAGKQAATQVFESAGINFAYSTDRLLKPYYLLWVRNPPAIDPATKMPVYLQDDGQSPLPDIYNGDGLKQLDAIWQYLRLGDNMPPPPSN